MRVCVCVCVEMVVCERHTEPCWTQRVLCVAQAWGNHTKLEGVCERERENQQGSRPTN